MRAVNVYIYIVMYIYVAGAVKKRRVTHTQCPYIVFRNRFLYGFVLVYICQDGGTVGFVAFTKLSFTLSSLAQPFDQI